MTDELYCDGISEITVTGPIVRLDMTSLSPSKRDSSGNPEPVLRQRVIMPIEAFANSVDLMQKALNGLVEAGALRRNSAVTPAGDGARLEQPSANTSPNFN